MNNPSQLMIDCPYCGEHFESPMEHLGQVIACPSCQSPFGVPKSKSVVVPDSPAPVQQEKESSKLYQAIGIVLALLAMGVTKSFIDSHKPEFNKAVGTITSLATGNTKDTNLHDAVTHFQSGDIDSAIADCTQAIRLNPKSSDAYQFRGMIYMRKGDLCSAVADYTEAIHLKPKDANIYSLRSMIYLCKGEYEKAIIDCNEAIQLNPKLADAYVVRGSAYGGKGDFIKAIADCTQALRFNPNNAAVYGTRGSAYMRISEFDKATDDLNRAIQLNPKYAEAYWVRGITYEHRGASKKAKLDFDEAAKLGFKTPSGIVANVTKSTAIKSAIHEAVRAKDIQTVKSLVQKNPACLWEIEDDGAFGYTPLHVAVHQAEQSTVKLLLSKGQHWNC